MLRQAEGAEVLVSLLFPLLLFVIVLALFRIEHRFVPTEQEPQPGNLLTGQEDGGDSLLQHIDLWERIDPAIEGEQGERSLRPVDQTPGPRRLVARPSTEAEHEPHALPGRDRSPRERRPDGGRRTAPRTPAA